MPQNMGQRIQKLRLEKGFSLSELADRADVAKSYLSNVERNIQSNPSIQFIEKIADALQVSIRLVQEAMASGISKREFKEFLDFQKWKLDQKD